MASKGLRAGTYDLSELSDEQRAWVAKRTGTTMTRDEPPPRPRPRGSKLRDLLEAVAEMPIEAEVEEGSDEAEAPLEPVSPLQLLKALAETIFMDRGVRVFKSGAEGHQWNVTVPAVRVRGMGKRDVKVQILMRIVDTIPPRSS